MEDDNIKQNNNQDFNPVEKEKKEKKRVIKTYRDFAVNALEDNPTSLANMIIKEKKKRERKEDSSVRNPKNMFVITISIILSFIGVAAIAMSIFFVSKTNEDSNDKKFSAKPIFIVDNNYEVGNELKDYDNVKKSVSDLLESVIPIGTIKGLYFTKKDQFGYNKQAIAKDFMDVLDTRVPNQFIRNLDNEFSLGIVNTYSNGNKPFLVLKTINFDSSYNNMLAWEKTMLYDVGILFGVNQKYYGTQFSDIILFNKDVRAVLDNHANLVFGYSFIDPHRIVFFTDSQVLKTVINNLKNIVKK